MGTSAEAIRAAFRARIKQLKCPSCELEFTDYAVNWFEAWLEGRNDLMREEGRFERDAPVKLCCEVCGRRAWTNSFLSPPKRAEE